MRTKAIKALSQLRDDRLFDTVAEGLDTVAENATRIARAARALAQQKEVRGARILTAVAEEEAAKYLILLDAIRCPRHPQALLADHLPKFNSHLAKGIYADACSWRAWTLEQLRDYVDQERVSAYLDGPNDVDWVFPNHITRQREEALYVDFVQNEDGQWWSSPTTYEDETSAFFYEHSPAAVALVTELHAAGCGKAESLRIIAETWRPLDLGDTTERHQMEELTLETLQTMQSRGLLVEQQGYSLILHDWQFPMYGLEMGLIDVPEAALRRIQGNRYPG